MKIREMQPMTSGRGDDMVDIKGWSEETVDVNSAQTDILLD